jgi:ferredoxin-type protein NapG
VPGHPLRRRLPHRRLDRIEDAEMGVAVIDTESCLSWQGLRCEVCHRECPIQGEAIRLEHRSRLTSKHAMLLPVVNSESCTGCGICEAQCPTEEWAIRVLPPELVTGRIGAHDRLGWEHEAGITQEYEPHAGEVERPGTQAPIDYLHEAGR